MSQKSYLIRYWNKQTGNSHTKPVFPLSKASPLSAVESASFAKLASTHNHNASPLDSQPSVRLPTSSASLIL
ncbi:polygalacturonase 1 beta-like protein 2 [Quercus suber]|uniref:Polygalacturonase 1 beta-like protein 2 n=1 Tax=Quercus suber TaxID=58331 RepID=A0AAW0L2F3_QUESU